MTPLLTGRESEESSLHVKSSIKLNRNSISGEFERYLASLVDTQNPHLAVKGLKAQSNFNPLFSSTAILKYYSIFKLIHTH